MADKLHKLKDQLDRPLRDLRISVTDRCNFRCRYCMPEEIFGPDYQFLPREDLLSFEEITRLTRLFVDLGVEKIRITGGEPLLRRDLDKLIRMLTDMEGVKDIALTTNGSLLDKHAVKLKAAGLDRVTVSLDSLDNERFGQMNGRGFPVEPVIRGIDAALEAGLQVKVNMVVQKGVNDEDVLPMAQFFREKGVILRFVEYMDVGNTNGWRLDQVLPSREIVERIGEHIPLEPVDPNYFGEVAKRYRYQDGRGEIGFISSVTEAFCSSCTRARLSADGHFFTCLFAASGYNLLAPLREGESDAQLVERISAVWNKRVDRYSEIRHENTDEFRGKKKVEMSRIGG